MISNKKDLLDYLEQDKAALNIKGKYPSLFGHDVWKFQIALRYYEYYFNTYKNHKRFRVYYKVLRKYWNLRWYRYSIRLGFDIPINVFGPGLNIHHYGCIVVNENASVGKNCNIQQHVTIGMNKSNKCAKIGDNVFIGTGAKIIGDIRIANGCIIGANAVVVDDFLEENSVIGGVPAKKIR